MKILPLILKYRVPLLIINFIIIIFISFGIHKLKNNYDLKNWMSKDDAYILNIKKFENKLNSNEKIAIGFSLRGKDKIWSPSFLRFLKEVSDDLDKLDDIIRVDSLVNVQEIDKKNDNLRFKPFLFSNGQNNLENLEKKKLAAQKNPLYSSYYFDKDNESTTIYLYLTSFKERESSHLKTFDSIKKIIKAKIENHHFEDEVNISYSGHLVLESAFKEAFEKDLAVMSSLLFFILIFVLYFILRRSLAVSLSLLNIFLFISCVYGLAGFFCIELNNVSLIGLMLLLSLGLMNNVGILKDYLNYFNEENTYSSKEREGLTVKALEYAFSQNVFLSFIVSALLGITCATFISSPLIPIKNLGIIMSLSCFLSWYLVFTFLIPILSYGFILPPLPSHSAKADQERERDFISSLILFIMKNKKIILIGFILFLFLLSFFIFKTTKIREGKLFYHEDRFSEIKAFKEDIEILVDSGAEEGIKEPDFLNKVDLFQGYLDSVPSIIKSRSILDDIKIVNKVLHSNKASFYIIPSDTRAISQNLISYSLLLPDKEMIKEKISKDGSALRISLIAKKRENQLSLKLIKDIEKKAENFRLKILIDSDFLLHSSFEAKKNQTFIRSFFLSLGLIFFLLIFYYRSISLAFFSLIPASISFLLSLGIWVLFKGLSMGLVIALSVSLALLAINSFNSFFSQFPIIEAPLRRLFELKGVEGILRNFYSKKAKLFLLSSLVLSIIFSILLLGDYIPNFDFALFCVIILFIDLLLNLLLWPAFFAFYPKCLMKLSLSKT